MPYRVAVPEFSLMLRETRGAVCAAANAQSTAAPSVLA
jgi:hypothetical protein